MMFSLFAWILIVMAGSAGAFAVLSLIAGNIERFISWLIISIIMTIIVKGHDGYENTGVWFG